VKEFQSTRFLEIGEARENAPVFIWAHGWGQDHKAMLEICAPSKGNGRHIMLDFPGFGESPKPDNVWGTEDYADHVAALLRDVTDTPVIWIGHSFGCRVGLRLAARYPELVKGLFLVGGAGIPKQLPFYKSIYFKTRIALYKVLKKLIPLGLSEDWLISKFGSADYKNADPVMRQILVKVVNEDLRDIAPRVQCPVHFVYGEKDTDAPPVIGEKLSALISNADLSILKDQDHYSVLGSGRHQVTALLKRFIENL